MLNQLRSNHVALNFYLHRIKKRDDPFCEHCSNSKETIRHFLFECPANREARRSTLDPLGRQARHAAFLLSSPIGTKVLHKYIAKTERFQTQDGVG
jgi:hypothetical protein